MPSSWKRNVGAVQSKATKLVVLTVQVRSRTHATFQTVPLELTWLNIQAELLGSAAAGVKPPQVHGQSARYRYDGFLANGAHGM